MENNQILSEEDFEKLKTYGMTEDDIEELKMSLTLVEAGEAVPEDIDGLLKRIEEYFPSDDPQKTIQMFFELPEKDPEFFNQILALQTFVGVVDSPIEETHVGDALRQIRVAETEEEKQELTTRLFNRIKGLNAESKATFLKQMQSLETNEKKELLDILNKK